MNPVATPLDVKLMNMTAMVLGLAFVVLGAVAAARWVSRLPAFDIQGILVSGDVAHNNTVTLRANVAPRLSGTFFTVDLARVRAAFESVPWVRHAVVQRIWPNRLAVRLEEHRAAALWATESGSDKLVNSFGEVFEANPGDVDEDTLPVLQGPDGSSQRLLALHQRLQPVVAGLGARIDMLSMSGRSSLTAELDSGAEVEIGRGSDDEIVERMQRFVATVPQVIAQHNRPLVHADLRHNDGYAVRLKGVSTSVPGASGRN